jgi:hypothetical protein
MPKGKTMRTLLLVFFMMISSCTQYVTPVTEQKLPEKINFLEDRKSRLDEVVSQLGNPNEIYESGRILIYRPCEDEKGKLVFTDKVCNLSLVLVFSSEGVLERHSLIRGK